MSFDPLVQAAVEMFGVGYARANKMLGQPYASNLFLEPSMQVKDIAIAVDVLLSDESKWAKGTMARKANGQGTTSLEDDAVCFCLMGAEFKVTQGASIALCLRLKEHLKLHKDKSITTWNDAPERTFKEVKDALRSFIDGQA